MLARSSFFIPILFFSIMLFIAQISPATAIEGEAKEQTEKKEINTSELKQSPKEAKKSDTLIQTMPISSYEQHKNDLKHYFPAEQVKTLLAGPNKFITLIKKYSNENAKGVAILLPDWQQSVTSSNAISFLRRTLPEHGWTTIAIQPASKPDNYPSKALTTEQQKKDNDTALDIYKTKLSAMISSVMTEAKKNPGIVIIIAQGNNGAMLTDLYQKNKNKPANALILLSSYIQTNASFINSANEYFSQCIATSNYPVLDLSLRQDQPLIISKIKQRAILAKQEMKVYYRHRQLNNVNIGYYPEKELLLQINSWLKSMGW